jgi:S1-C subfamily serine protease
MSNRDNDNSFDIDPNPVQRPGVLAWMTGFLAVGLVLLTAVVVLLPYLHKSWVESDPLFEAKREAEWTYRKKEAELKAESEAMGRRLDKIEVAPSAFKMVVTKADPAVVSVTHEFRPAGRRDLQQLGFGQDIVQTSQGSGVLVRVDNNKTAYILTNCHVVQPPDRQMNQPETGADKITIALASERQIEVDQKTIYLDRETDLALIQIDVSEVPHVTVAEFADSDAIDVGDWVVAIGSPFGWKHSVTKGIISAKGRQRVAAGTQVGPNGQQGVRPLDDIEMIQIDAPINPGNSGGPLFDMKGRLIGINTLIFSENGVNQGVGFAIPSNLAHHIVDTLLQPPHKVVRGCFGVAMENMPPEALQKLGLQGAVRITAVDPHYPAAAAGVQTGDIIYRYNGELIKDDLRFLRLVMDTAPLSNVPVDIIRGGEKLTLNVTVTERPASFTTGRPFFPRQRQR